MKVLPVNIFGVVASDMAKKPVQQEKRYDLPKYDLVPLGLHKNQISFGRSWEEHKSWGATLNPDSTANFKIYTYPDVRKVYVEVLKDPKESDQTDKIWKRGLSVEQEKRAKSGTSKKITGIKPIDDRSEIFELDRKESPGGPYFQKRNIKGIAPGKFYRFIIVDKNNAIKKVKDPYSKEQRGVLSWSGIHNPNNYQWGDDKWVQGFDLRRVSRFKSSNLTPVAALRIMEVNIPTLTKGGKFLDAIPVMDHIAKNNLANAVEFMPFENANSKGWSYDGVDKFAINERLGTSNELKQLIDHCHKIGLNVILDTVPNHVGDDGNLLGKTGPYEKQVPDESKPGKTKTAKNPAGPMLNYEGPGNRYVRDWMANAVLHWAKEYHVDGFRVDMTNPGYMGSDFALQQINAEMNHHFPNVFMIAEDGRGGHEGRDRLVTPINQAGAHEDFIEKIDNQIERVIDNQVDQVDQLYMGFDSDWDFDLYHGLKEMLNNPESYDIKHFNNLLMASQKRVGYPMSHDEQGNHDGTSGVVKYAATRLDLLNKIPELSNDKEENKKLRGQKAAAASQWLLELYAEGKLDKIQESQMQDELRSKFKVEGAVTKESVAEAYDWGIGRAKLGMGTVWTTPGPKMFFQGYENGSLNLFKFFRDLTTGSEPDEISKKGYDTSTAKALADSLPDRIDYKGKVKDTMAKMEQYSSDLSKLVADNPALQDGWIMKDSTVIHENNPQVLANLMKKDDNEIFSIKNFSHVSYVGGHGYGTVRNTMHNIFSTKRSCGITFPEGTWVEVLNSDDTKYAGEEAYTNKGITIKSNGHSKKFINIGSSDVSVWKRVG